MYTGRRRRWGLGNLVYERLSERPTQLYGEALSSLPEPGTPALQKVPYELKASLPFCVRLSLSSILDPR